MKAGSEDLQSGFEPFNGVLLCRLVQALVIDTTHAEHDPQITALGEEHFLIPESVEVDLGVERSRFVPRLENTVDTEH